MILPVDDERIAIINCLQELDCCSRCILRYLGVKSNEMYLKPEYYLNIFNENRDENRETNVFSEIPPKKMKNNPCRACLDIFQNSTMEKFVDTIARSKVIEYNYTDFVTSVSFPKSILIRDRSIFIYLKEKYPHIYDNFNDLEMLKKVFRISSNEIITQKIGKIYSPHSNFNLIFEIVYEDDESEVQNIKNINITKKRGRQQDTSRNVIVDILEKCSDQIFKKQFPVPPNVPYKQPECLIHFMAEPMWIGGRYLKFSRNMGQTPWVINEKLMAEHCLQDILYDSIEKILGCDKTKLTFCASGREDADVRMLGNGRPFYIQMDDPKDRSITFEKYREIEMEIFKTKLAAVIKLQAITKSDIKRIKEGEEHKCKHYYALCHVKSHDINNIINKINGYSIENEVLEIQQKTPLRVLHRRTQAIRKKYIYSMEAKTVSGYSDLFEIKIVTQAGTYVKEFINGDFERTQPNLSSIIQHPVDIIALDVTKIELVWPEEVTNKE